MKDIKKGDTFYVEGHERSHICVGFEDNDDVIAENGLPYLKEKCSLVPFGPAPTVATDNSGEDWLGGPEPKDISDLESENKELLDIVHELFSQACYQHEQGAEYGMYDHMCISTYEEAQSLLIKHNRIKKEQCYRD